ncbi:hypothetical protein CDV31_001747 [Fusarium ambrosium]|uniref:Uncharacterized protein n=1 Tax=Fusarium ambrosium TaxID=131363 RepID=A0A428UYE9_9HYPO|nr:hypothetical protein CDV31_001747 [Fusarium ambrosium]
MHLDIAHAVSMAPEGKDLNGAPRGPLSNPGRDFYCGPALWKRRPQHGSSRGSLSAFPGSKARRLIQGRDGEIDHGCQPAQAKNSQDSLVVYPSSSLEIYLFPIDTRQTINLSSRSPPSQVRDSHNLLSARHVNLRACLLLFNFHLPSAPSHP